ncbi:ABC transporter substrate-binding protein [Micromonospora inyonensis]|uniref:Iron complex transport system substrate-binding protein n=1 Tax=Micromonospora inyonensis TaxID=47866 RepID=A0A1C6RS34_9ACTN|nr:ABC transporter substrate-binding protein [Micromonospora inyonensis]SCL19882.1 iron complex transport system substrate-binding protein [Micromonospora inyonensis]
MTVFPPGRTRVTALVLGLFTLTACTSGEAGSSAATGAITVQNCGQDVSVDKPVTRLYAYDGGIISIVLSVGARDQLIAVTGMDQDRDVIELAYPEARIDQLKEVGDEHPTLENVLAVNPEMMFAGYGYGFSESRNLMPEDLTTHGIKTYLLSETCKQDNGARGTMDAWTALTTDLRNVGTLTGHRETADTVVADIEKRRTALAAAPRGGKPTAFLFDSGTDAIFTSGSYGGPQAIFDAAGVTNATADVKDTWTEVGWERLAASNPDVIFFVDYPGQSYQQKVDTLKANPASRNLKAVKDGRFVNLPYAMWVSGPLNIDAAEWVREAMEHFGVVPKSSVSPTLDIRQLSKLPGNDWLK